MTEFWIVAFGCVVPAVGVGIAIHSHWRPIAQAYIERCRWLEKQLSESEADRDRLALALRKSEARLNYVLVTSGEIMRDDLEPEEWAEAKLWGAERPGE
jgi:F0F1-type ATP synthase membrane subunit b/b'